MLSPLVDGLVWVRGMMSLLPLLARTLTIVVKPFLILLVAHPVLTMVILRRIFLRRRSLLAPKMSRLWMWRVRISLGLGLVSIVACYDSAVHHKPPCRSGVAACIQDWANLRDPLCSLSSKKGFVSLYVLVHDVRA